MKNHELSDIQCDVDRVERFQSLQAGQYWRALQDIDSDAIEKDTVLLIQSIRDVDNSPHTIILRAHPEKYGQYGYIDITDSQGNTCKRYVNYKEHRFLLNDFLSQFEYEPDHAQIRQQELQRLQQKTVTLQQALMDSQTDPLYLQPVINDALSKADSACHTNLPMVPDQHQAALRASTGRIASILEDGVSEYQIQALKQAVSKEHQIATIKAKWIQDKTTEIANTIQAMTPFFEEQAAATLAQTEDVKRYVATLMQGIESLDLYVGKHVEVVTVTQGESAPRSVPLTVMQQKLMMDEELAVFVNIGERFDFTNQSLFIKTMSEHPALINQIFPTQRCVLIMATTRRFIDYGDKWTNVMRNDENRKVFLLIRDGDNVYQVFSPVESHLGSSKLFPSKADQEAIFKNNAFGFRGMDCSQIKFEDVAYTDKLAKHELFALHYKRFLILLCGLDHRLKLLGDFYDEPQSFDFITQEFQEKYFRFISDDDASANLPTVQRPSVDAWLVDKNQYLKSGSRVLCKWSDLMNLDTAPGAYYGGDYRGYNPSTDMDVCIAAKDGQHLYVNIAVTGYNAKCTGERTFDCKVTLTKFNDSNYDYDEFPYLCLDTVTAEELIFYIHNRQSRKNHVAYIRFFKTALRYIENELRSEAPTRQLLMTALQEGGVAEGAAAKDLVQQAVVAWRASHRGKALPDFSDKKNTKEWVSLLNQLFALAGQQKDIAEQADKLCVQLGYQPLRLTINGKAQYILYAAPKKEEMDNRLEAHHFVHRFIIECHDKNAKYTSKCWAILPSISADETILHAWSDESDWLFSNNLFDSFEKKASSIRATKRLSSSYGNDYQSTQPGTI